MPPKLAPSGSIGDKKGKGVEERVPSVPRTATGSRSSSLGKSVRGVPLAGHQRAVSAAQVASPRGRTGLRTTRNSVRSVTLEESTSNTPVPLSTELSTEETIATTTDVSTVSSALSTITPSEEDLPSIATIPDLENLNALRLRFETNRTTFVRSRSSSEPGPGPFVRTEPVVATDNLPFFLHPESIAAPPRRNRPLPPLPVAPAPERLPPVPPVRTPSPVMNYKPMPPSTSSHAPKFTKGNPHEIQSFLAAFNDRAREAGLSDKEKIERVVHYVDHTTKSNWTALDEYEGDSWIVLERAILASYIIDDKWLYSLLRFESFVREYRDGVDGKRIDTLEGFMEFHRTATTFAKHLKKDQTTSVDQVARVYATVFDGTSPVSQRLREQIRTQLRIDCPTVHPNHAYSILQVKTAAVFMLQGAIDEESRTPIISTDTAVKQELASNHKLEAKLELLIQQVASVTQIVNEQRVQVNAVVRPYGNTMVQAPYTPSIPVSSQGPYAPRAPFDPSRRPQGTACAYCSIDGHFKRDCPDLQADKIAGVCIQNETWRILMADGSEPPYQYGVCLRDRVRAHASRTNGSSTAATVAPSLVCEAVGYTSSPHPCYMMSSAGSLYECDASGAPIETVRDGEGRDESEPGDEETEDAYQELARLEVYAQDLKEKGKGKGRSKPAQVTVEVPRMTRSSGAKPVPPGSKALLTAESQTPEVVKEKGRTAPMPIPVPVQPKPMTLQPDRPVAKAATIEKVVESNAGFVRSYSSPAEEDRPDAGERVFEQILRSEVNLPVADLLALSPELRKRFRDYCTSKRVSRPTVQPSVPTVSIVPTVRSKLPAPIYFSKADLKRQLTGGLDEEGNIVARDLLPLRSIDVNINGKVDLTAVLDTGSSITAIHRHAWENMHDIMRVERKYDMEGVNGERTSTMGIIHNARVRIGTAVLIMHIHVLENAPFALLLGQPFFALTQSIMEHEPDGGMTLTMRDPNTHELHKVATRARVSNRPEMAMLGF